jgi:hypothetical protein
VSLQAAAYEALIFRFEDMAEHNLCGYFEAVIPLYGQSTHICTAQAADGARRTFRGAL